MVNTLVGAFLVAHGLITTSIGFSSVTNPDAAPMAMPAWFGWWPGPFGRSWLFQALDLGSGVAVVGGLLWLAAGAALVIGGLGWIGVPALADLKVPLLIGGASLGLVALALYFHPFYLVAVLIDLAVIVLLWGRLAPAGS
jgi:hypothetical protein